MEMAAIAYCYFIFYGLTDEFVDWLRLSVFKKAVFYLKPISGLKQFCECLIVKIFALHTLPNQNFCWSSQDWIIMSRNSFGFKIRFQNINDWCHVKVFILGFYWAWWQQYIKCSDLLHDILLCKSWLWNLFDCSWNILLVTLLYTLYIHNTLYSLFIAQSC